MALPKLPMMQHKLVSLVGPTATGKTQIGMGLADWLVPPFAGVDLISADSRQVYKGLELIAGADVPEDFNQKTSPQFPFPFFERGATRLHGVSIVEPTEDWSLAHFRDFAQAVMQQSWQEGRLPVVVGGTGLYHQWAASKDTAIAIPPNTEIRTKAAKLALTELQAWLEEVSRERWQRMTHSDRQNPRRLVRALEVALAEQQQSASSKQATYTEQFPEIQHQFFGLTDTRDALATRIQQRVQERFQAGAIEEATALAPLVVAAQQAHAPLPPALTATGVKELLQFVQEKVSQEEALQLWTQREVSYAKRQRTWWKKAKSVTWFEVGEEGWREAVWQAIATKVKQT